MISEEWPRTPGTVSFDTKVAIWVECHRRVLVGIAALGTLLWFILFLQFTVDDAFISFRYGKILLQNHTWNWNPSGDRVESYTSAVYAVLAILPLALNIPVALFFKGFGVLCVIVLVYRLRNECGSAIGVTIGILLIGLNPWLWIHVFSGLETPFYMLLIVEMALCVKHSSEAKVSYVMALFLLLPLTRPEGIVFSVAGAVLLCASRRYDHKLLCGLAGSVAVGLLYFVLRWRYFGELLPNPFYIKTAHTSFRDILMCFSWNITDSRIAIVTLLIVSLATRTKYVRIFAFCALALLVLLFAPGNLLMNFASRFFFQLSFPVFLLFFLAEDVRENARLAVVVAALALFSFSPMVSPELWYFPYLRVAHMDLGTRLAPYAKGHTMMIGDNGVVPYYSNWTTYDFIGLCNQAVARKGLTEGLIQQIHPDLIVLYNNHAGPDIDFADVKEQQATIQAYMKHSGEYEYAGSSHWAQFYLVEFLRKDTADRAAIARALAENEAYAEQHRFSMVSLLEQKYVPLR